MKRVLVFLVVFATLITLAVAVPADTRTYAQGFGVVWDSSIQVLNLSDTEVANIVITYYQQDGTVVLSVNDTVQPGQSNTYFPIHAPAGFNGSVVISSDKPVAVVTNLIVNTPQKGLGSYVGFQQGAPTIYFPLVMKGNAYNTTTLNVQNTGSTSADITIHFTPEAGSTYPTVLDITDTIQPGAAKTYDLSTLSQFSGIAKWVGSATVSVADPANDSIAGVATTVNQRYPSAYQLYTYNAFTKGSTTVVLPLIQENNNGNRTSVNCQNISSSTSTTVTVTYIPETGYGPKPAEAKTNVPPNGVAVFLQDYRGMTKWVGSARVTSDPAVPLVCVVNQQRPDYGTGSAYEGFDPAAATDTVVLPLIQSRNGSAATGWVYTSINLATADGNPHEITCDFKPAPGFADPPSITKTGASVVFLQNDVYGTGAKFIGGAVCKTSDGAGLFAIVNQSRQNTPVFPRDTLATYDGFNQ
jgi:hypothetical protein